MRGRLALACLLLAAGAAPAASLDVKPAWAGWIGTESGSTELEVHVPASEIAGTARLEVGAGRQRVLTRIELQRGVPRELRLLVPALTPLVVRLVQPDGQHSTATPELRRSERPLLARVGLSGMDGEALSLIDVAPADLPRLAGAYTSVAGIAIDAASLALLDPEQTAALLSHVRSCGFTLLTGAGAEVLAALRHAAGCGGQAVIAWSAAPTAAELEAAFAARPLVAPLGAAVAARFAGPDARVSWLIAALAGYLALLAALIAFTDRPAWLLPAPLAGTALIAAFLALAPQHASVTVWAEAMSGEHTASYVGRLQQRAFARARVALALPALLGAPRPCDEGDAMTLEWNAEAARFTSAVFPARLLASPALCYEGGFPMAQSGRLAPGGAGRLALTNTGPAPWHDAWLVWHGTLFELAPLAPSGVLQIDPAAGRAAQTAEQRLAIARTGWQDATLLMPLALGTLDAGPGAAIGTSSGWLLMHLIPGTDSPT